ncbi:MAG TPA: CrcB family protein [Planctomycetota bacterium]|nr:CrcB family protein [Planctomycetota bacterium]
MTWFWIASAGALGAVLRYALGELLAALAGATPPLGAFAANVLGCFLFGLVTGLIPAENAGPLRVALLVGFLGSFTTFSTYVGDVVQLVQAGRLAAAAGWVAAHNGLGLLALLAGAGAAGLTR